MPYATTGKPRRATHLPARIILDLAWRNLMRQKARTAMTLAAIAFGVAGLILSGGFIQDVFVKLAEAIIHSQSGHIQLAKAGYFSHGSRTPEKYLIAEPDADKARIATLPEVKDVMARLSFSGLLNNGRTDLAVVGEGIEPEKEAALGTFLKISEGRHLSGNDHDGALIGKGVARALKIKPGDRLTLLLNTAEGAMNTLDLVVVGVFQSFSKDYDARAVKIPLSAAQEILGTRGANLLVVSLNSTADTERITHTLRERTMWRDQEVKTWEELNDFYPKTVQLYDRQFGVLQIIILVMVLLSVVNVVNMSVFERVGEFGTLKALGNRNGDVLRLVITENVLLGLTGAAVGAAAGMALAWAISQAGIPMPPPPNSDLGYTAHIRIVPWIVISAFVVGCCATILASLLPAFRVARLPVVDALRQNV